MVKTGVAFDGEGYLNSAGRAAMRAATKRLKDDDNKPEGPVNPPTRITKDHKAAAVASRRVCKITGQSQKKSSPKRKEKIRGLPVRHRYPTRSRGKVP